MQKWFGFYREGPHYEPHVIQIDAAGDLGYVAYFYHVTGTTKAGGEMDMWVRSTQVCRHTADGWSVVHAHESVPMDPESGQALIAEEPPGGVARPEVSINRRLTGASAPYQDPACALL